MEPRTSDARTSADSDTSGSSEALKKRGRPLKRRRRSLDHSATNILRKWLNEHALHPFPNVQERNQLCAETGLSGKQVSKWYDNARARLLKNRGVVYQPKGRAKPKPKAVRKPKRDRNSASVTPPTPVSSVQRQGASKRRRVSLQIDTKQQQQQPLSVPLAIDTLDMAKGCDAPTPNPLLCGLSVITSRRITPAAEPHSGSKFIRSPSALEVGRPLLGTPRSFLLASSPLSALWRSKILPRTASDRTILHDARDTLSPAEMDKLSVRDADPRVRTDSSLLMPPCETNWSSSLLPSPCPCFSPVMMSEDNPGTRYFVFDVCLEMP